MPTKIKTFAVRPRSGQCGEGYRSAEAHLDLNAVVAALLITALVIVNLILRFPEFGEIIACYNQF